ncbi:MAG: ATP-binding protein [Bacteroidetes bacterium]|nr:ATP-binding protein [Bacteroidota bacterium]
MYPTFQMTLNSGYVMAVEDSMVQAKKLKNFLDQNSIRNILFSTADEAFYAAIADPPVLIISDIVMPGMSGYEFCTKLKNHHILKEIPVILLTSLRDPLDIIKGLQAGADNFITKPYEEQYLLSRIQYLLANRELRKAGSAEMVIEIVFRGNKYAINSEKKQILDLLLSVYEAAIQRNDQLISTQVELEASNENLLAANQELEAFSYTVSHDLRSPLNVVAGYTQLLQADYGDKLDEEGNEYLERMLHSAFSMAKLIDDLLKFSRSGRTVVTPEYVNLTEMADKLVDEIKAREKDLKADIQIQRGLLSQADPSLMNVVLDNLLGNALKYSGKNDHPVIIFDKMISGRETVFFVRDNGAGFDMAKADKLFNPFQRLHTNQEFQGTGIGLATVKRIIERHGGRIWAESEPGKGATFFFTLGI